MRFYTTETLSQNRSRSPEGFLICSRVPLARIGTMKYNGDETPVTPGEDGTTLIHREPDEVFRPETLASALGKPITNNHPDDDVTPENWRYLAMGSIMNVYRGEGAQDDLMMGDLIITHERGIELVEGGKVELSLGYDADYEELQPGVGRQRNIIINHVALVDEGRCGPRCKIGDERPVTTNPIDRAKRAFRDGDEAAFNQIIDQLAKGTPKMAKRAARRTGDTAFSKVKESGKVSMYETWDADTRKNMYLVYVGEGEEPVFEGSKAKAETVYAKHIAAAAKKPRDAEYEGAVFQLGSGQNVGQLEKELAQAEAEAKKPHPSAGALSKAKAKVQQLKQQIERAKETRGHDARDEHPGEEEGEEEGMMDAMGEHEGELGHPHPGIAGAQDEHIHVHIPGHSSVMGDAATEELHRMTDKNKNRDAGANEEAGEQEEFNFADHAQKVHDSLGHLHQRMTDMHRKLGHIHDCINNHAGHLKSMGAHDAMHAVHDEKPEEEEEIRDEAAHELKEDFDEEAPEGTGDRRPRKARDNAPRTRARDSAHLEGSYQDVVSMAEILVPGVRFPTYDSRDNAEATLRRLCGFQGSVLDMFYQSDEGKTIVDEITGQTRYSARDCSCKETGTVFRAAATAKKLINNGGVRRQVSDIHADIGTGGGLGVKGALRTPADLNALYKERYNVNS